MNRGKMIRLGVNALGFQAVWFASILGAAHDMPWAGLVVVALYVPIHLRLSPTVRADMVLLVLFGLAGTLLDSVYAMTDLITYRGELAGGDMAPPWISALWVGFGLSLTGSMAWLTIHPALSAFACGIIGTAAYGVGVFAGSAQILTDTVTGYGVIGVMWALVGLSAAILVPRLLAREQDGLSQLKSG